MEILPALAPGPPAPGPLPSILPRLFWAVMAESGGASCLLSIEFQPVTFLFIPC
ncbi:Uncharacterized protein BM_BM10742 [Brugia malayi]|uniref:Bm10742 n=2 Tax=Brugia malayi TaxID=6279 RepID=A0A0K0IPC0_BRUMA|nr:Uncharacterized protein BM_BM10742 [Brugia malayi]CDP99396.1 Bm10742 [Brugia malayi]VIO99847.1 Uncharacterized protein BM_BM10742 [Brugia malayi]